jgi:hypothetical protein
VRKLTTLLTTTDYCTEYVKLFADFPHSLHTFFQASTNVYFIHVLACPTSLGW